MKGMIFLPVVVSFIVFVYSLNSGETWRIVSSAVGFGIFLIFAVLVFYKERKKNTSNNNHN